MSIPRIEIRQQYAQLGIDADIGKQDLQQPRPTMEMRQVQPTVEIRNPLGHFEIDQSRAWDAYGLGGNLETMHRIYSQAPDLALRGLAKIVEYGNRLAAIHQPGNPIADRGREWMAGFPEIESRGEASVDNVDLQYIRGDLSIELQRGRIDTEVQVNPPIHHYERGKLDIYMQQYGRVDIIPPQIDVAV